MSKVKIIFIDWDGTSCVNRFWEGNKDYHKIQEALFVNNKDLVNNWMIGVYSAEHVCGIVAGETNIGYDDLVSDLERSCRAMQLVSSEILGLVFQLRSKRIKVAIATDNMDTFTRWTLPALELDKHYDSILNSFDLKVSKRKGEDFFGKFLEENGINPDECVIIDDSEDRNGVLTDYGFDYRRIERGIGLVPELKLILEKI